MGKPKIDAKQALDDIRSGMDDQSLMEKYAISAKGLQRPIQETCRCGSHQSV